MAFLACGEGVLLFDWEELQVLHSSNSGLSCYPGRPRGPGLLLSGI